MNLWVFYSLVLDCNLLSAKSFPNETPAKHLNNYIFNVVINNSMIIFHIFEISLNLIKWDGRDAAVLSLNSCGVLCILCGPSFAAGKPNPILKSGRFGRARHKVRLEFFLSQHTHLALESDHRIARKEFPFQPRQQCLCDFG